MPPMRKLQGFTLLELLVVIVIIGLLAGYVAPRYFSQVGRSEIQVARAQIESLEKALDQYRLDTRNYPSTEDGLEAVNVACELALEANAINDSYVLNALNRLKPQPPVEIVVAPPRLQLKEEPKADVARYDRLLKKLAVAAIAAMPMLLAAVSHRAAEVPCGTP